MSKQGTTKLLNNFVNLTDEFGNSYKFNKNTGVFYEDDEEINVDEGSVFYADEDRYEYVEGQLKKSEEEESEVDDSELEIDPEDYTEHTKKVEEEIKNIKNISRSSNKVENKVENKSPKSSKEEKIKKMIEESDRERNKNREFENFDEVFNAFFRKGKTESEIYFELRRRLTLKIFKETGVSSSAAISLGHLIMTKLKLDVKYSPEIEKIIKMVINKI